MDLEQLKRVVIKEEFVAITEDTLEAIILNQFLYWSDKTKDFDKFLLEEKERKKKTNSNNEEEKEKDPELLHGWIYKKAAELKDEIMATESVKTVSRKTDNLVSKGFLDRRNNPKEKYDRTYQYRINIENIILALANKGYTLQGYKFDLDIYKNTSEASDTNKGQNDDLKRQNDFLKGQIDDLKRQVDDLKRQGVAAIPETTTKTTTKTTTEIEEVPLSDGDDIINFFRGMKGELTEVSYNTWIMALKVIPDSDRVSFFAPNDFTVGIVKSKYLDLIKKYSKKYFGTDNIEFKIRPKEEIG